MKDWLGQEYDKGDRVIYAAGSGRSITMIIGEVVEIKVNGNVRIQPLKSSRWKQHSARTHSIDTRTGKRIDKYHDRNILSGGHYAENGTNIKVEYDPGNPGGRYFGANTGRKYGYYTEDGRRLEHDDMHYVPTVHQPWVKEVREDAPRPVTISVTANITKWNGE